MSEKASGNTNGASQPLDQIVFRWDSRNAAGNGGYGPVAYSCDAQDAREIYEEIRTALRPDGTQSRPSLGRLSLSGGRALAFKRVPGGDSTGRSAPICHGLVGDGALLSPTDCLALRNWRWPSERVSAERSGRVLDPVEVHAVLAEADNEHAPLVHELLASLAQLDFTALVAATLEHPKARLLVLAQNLGAPPAALAYGLAELFSRFRPKGWNFSTYETRDGGAYQLAFTPAWPESATQAADLVRVDLHSVDEEQWILPVARQVVAMYMNDDRRGFSVLEKAAEGTGFPDAASLEHILGHRVRAAKSTAPRPVPNGVTMPVPDVLVRHLPVSEAAQRPITPRPTAPLPATPRPKEPRRATPELITLQKTYPLQTFPLISALLRAYRSARRAQPQLSTKDMLFFVRQGNSGMADVQQSLGCYDGLALVEFIDWKNPQQGVHLILEQLASSRPRSTARGRIALALRALDMIADLEDAPEHTYELRLDLAEALFNVAVRPDARSLPVRDRLNAVVSSSWTADEHFGRDLMYRIVDEYKPLGVPEQSYRLILRLQAEALYGPGTRTAARAASADTLTAAAAPPQHSNVRFAVTFTTISLVLIALAIALGRFLGS